MAKADQIKALIKSHAEGKENRTLVTLDLDFSNPLRFPVAGTAGVVVVRPQRPLLSLICSTIEQAMPMITEGTVAGNLWIVEPRERRCGSERPA